MIVLDTNIFIYHLTAHPVFGPNAKRLMMMVESGEVEALSSMITYSEILTLPAKEKNHNLVKRYRELFLHYPHLEFVPVDVEIAHQAAVIRGENPKLKLMDAFILATASNRQVKALVTEDKHLKIPRSAIPVLTLKEFFS